MITHQFLHLYLSLLQSWSHWTVCHPPESEWPSSCPSSPGEDWDTCSPTPCCPGASQTQTEPRECTLETCCSGHLVTGIWFSEVRNCLMGNKWWIINLCDCKVVWMQLTLSNIICQTTDHLITIHNNLASSDLNNNIITHPGRENDLELLNNRIDHPWIIISGTTTHPPPPPLPFQSTRAIVQGYIEWLEKSLSLLLRLKSNWWAFFSFD